MKPNLPNFFYYKANTVEKKKARGRALKQTQSLFLPQSYPHVEKKKARGRALKRNSSFKFVIFVYKVEKKKARGRALKQSCDLMVLLATTE